MVKFQIGINLGIIYTYTGKQSKLLWFESFPVFTSGYRQIIKEYRPGRFIPHREFCGKQLLQGAFIAKGIDVKANTESLKKTSALFDKTLKGLIDGDSSLNLPKTE